MDNLKLDSYMKRTILQEYVHMIRNDLTSGIYIPAPDLGTSPKEMAVIYGELHIPECVTGKPLGIGGLPGRKEATGRGVAFSTYYAVKELLKKDISGMKIAVQGFGNVGSWTCYFLYQMGAKIIAVSDINGGIHNCNGIDIIKLMEYVNKNNTVVDFAGEGIKNEELLALNTDILIPAAVENVLTNLTAPKVKARLIVEGANGPTTKEADEILLQKDILVIPDILANSGGVIASYIEWKSAKSGSMTSTEEVYEFIDKTIEKSFNKIIKLSKDRKITCKESALTLAVEEVINAMENRGWI